MDGNGFKLEKIGHFFQVLMLHVLKILKKFSPLYQNSFDTLIVALQKHFAYDYKPESNNFSTELT